MEELEVFCYIVWKLWGNRNKLLHGGSSLSPCEILDLAGRAYDEFFECQKACGGIAMRHTCLSSKWKAPPSGCLKLKIDAGAPYIGAVIRDSDGVIRVSMVRRVEGSFSPHVAKCLATREGLLLDSEARLEVSIIETIKSCFCTLKV